MRPLAAALALALALPVPALARGVAGVEVPESATVSGQPLTLNGAWIRRKFFVQVYVGALYLPARTGDAAAILAADAPWLVSMTFRRDVDKEKILEAFRESFERNSESELAQLLPGLARFGEVLPDLSSGQVLTVDYRPGIGTTLTAPGGAAVTVPGRAFGVAILRSWLGDRPADDDLKKAMLGR